MNKGWRATHQAQKDAEKLHHVGVRHRVESSNKGVEDRNHGRDHDRHVDVDVYDHAQRGTCGNMCYTALRPELSAQLTMGRRP